jgi:hypothetical protein
VFVTPAPVRLLVFVLHLGKVAISVMGLFGPHSIRLIFMTVPFMIVIVLFVVVTAGLLIFGSQRGRGHHWGYESNAQQNRIQETGHNLFLLNVNEAFVAPNGFNFIGAGKRA